jgi:hypothetical protein
MEKIEKQRLEQLVRLGIVPSNKLPILVQGLENLSMGKQLLPNEREVISKYMDNLTSIMLNDTTVFNRAKLHTQKSKYQTEEITVNNGVKIFDNPEEEEQHRKQTERKLRVRAADKKERFKLLPAAVKKEKRKAGLDEDLLAINNTYQAVFEAALELYGVTNIRDLPEDKKAEFFIVVDSASSDNDLSDIEEDVKVKQAVGIASDKRYKKGDMTGAVNAIEKLKPGLSDHPQVKAVLKRQNENVETDIEQLDEKNVPTSPEKWAQAKSQAKAKFDVYPSAYANGWAAKKYKEMGGSWKSMKEEIELDEDEVGYQHRYAVKNGNAVKDNPKTTGEKDQPYHVYADSPEHAVRKHAKMTTPGMKKEEVELDEGRPSQRHPLEGHAYHEKSNAELVGIAKDAHAAAEAMKSHNTTAENKYRDQANDSATVRHFRKTSGTPDWYKKKYGLKEEVEQIDELSTPTMSSYVKKVGAENKFTKKRVDGLNLALNKIKSNSTKKEEVESVNELIGNQHKIDANKNGKVDAHDFKLLRAKKKQPQGADFAAQRRKERLASNGRMDENDDYYGSYDSMSKKEFKRKEMEHELGNEDGKKRKSYYSKPKSSPSVSVKKEEAELTFEEMTPAQKAERLRMIARAADRVQSGAAEKSVKKLAKRDMKSAGAQRGMAPLKKDVDEQIQILRKTIVEGTAREKIVAYKELNNLIQEKLKGEE